MKKEMTNDMTVGSPTKLIIQFMIPMCLGNVFQQFYRKYRFIDVFCDRMAAGTDQWICNSGIAVVWSKRYETDATLCGNVHLPDDCVCCGDDDRI